MSNSLVGKKIGKYEVRERLGRGGMAEVFKAKQPSLDRFVAIKLLHPFLSEDPEFKQRFEREARNIARLRHPNIVQVYDFDTIQEQELYYMVMEYVDGPTLRSRILEMEMQGRVFDLQEAIRITKETANALSYAHQRGMVHRDIKPANIMLDSDNRIVLTDFGIARIVSGKGMTASGAMVGTPAYMAPEQGLGESGDSRSDIYSLGIVLYQLVTGKVPFDAETPVAIVLKHVNDPLPAPSSINEEISEELERVIYKALAKSSDLRYQSAEEMINHLENLEKDTTLILGPKEDTSVLKARTSGAVTPAPMDQPQPAGPQGVTALLIVLLIAAVAMGSGWFLASSGTLDGYFEQVPIVEPLPEETSELLHY